MWVLRAGMSMVSSRYRGYSSINRKTLNTELYDIELVKQDLRNAFMTRLGERRGRPTFGSIIHDLIMEPFDDRTESAVIADAMRIFRMEPRVRVNSLNVYLDPDSHQIIIRANLLMIEFNMATAFEQTFMEIQ